MVVVPSRTTQMMVLNDAETNKKPHVFLRGNQANQGKIVPRQFPAVVAGEERQPFHEGSGRWKWLG